jgi:prefoldin subunit 5
MNQDRRANIENLVSSIQAQMSQISDEMACLRELQLEEQEAFDNLPEGLQQAERGQQMEAIAQALDDAISSLEDSFGELENNLEEVTSALDQ